MNLDSRRLPDTACLGKFAHFCHYNDIYVTTVLNLCLDVIAVPISPDIFLSGKLGTLLYTYMLRN